MKFILLYFRNQGITTLVRESDGMFCGSVMANRCGAGEDPNTVEIRLFLDNECALRYLKEVVAANIAHKLNGGPTPIEFEERDGDSRIVMPGLGGIQ